jgi:hypothetical protein
MLGSDAISHQPPLSYFAYILCVLHHSEVKFFLEDSSFCILLYERRCLLRIVFWYKWIGRKCVTFKRDFCEISFIMDFYS